MRKLRLDLDSLDVQSFATDEETPAGGTVHGQSGLCQSTYYGCTYTDWETCENTCQTCDQYTCWESCYGSCLTCYDETCALVC